ncbi:MAG: 30S ribosomal protein S6 [Clostridiales bacterium]|jgi:small subunit ribosomal protein S6|nr:30S ribosomal protein S6 [Clostridiales bacterium]
MAKTTANYEMMVILNTKLGEEAIKGLIEKYKEIIEENGGTVSEVNEWGKRKLAYPIQYETDGYYVLYNFESKPDLPTELNRVSNITEGVLRSLVTVK